MDQQQRPQPRQASRASRSAQVEEPTWLEEMHSTLGNSGLLELVTGEQRDEAAAEVVLAESGVEQWGGAMAATAEAEAEVAKPEGKLGEVYASHEQRQAGGLATTLDSSMQWELDRFKELWAEHKVRYEAVSQETDVPAVLIAAIHYRECSGDFTRYLHQGDPLGKAAVRVPTNIPIFHDWHEAAVHAINMKSAIRDSVGIDAETQDPVQLATFAEAYNGLGYHNRDRVSPYVYSGTDVYTGGKYVKDGVFSAKAKDKQLGVMVMMDAVDGLEGIDMAPLTPERAWARVAAGALVLRQGSDGLAVEHLQALLVAAGHDITTDGDFGPGTRRAVAAFQDAAGLEPDGVVGKGTAAALDARRSRRPDS